MKLIIIPKSLGEQMFVYAKKIMVKLKSNIFMMKHMDKISLSTIFMKSIGKIKSRLKRCRSLRAASKFMNRSKGQIMRAGPEQEEFSPKGQCEQAKRQRYPCRESWV